MRATLFERFTVTTSESNLQTALLGSLSDELKPIDARVGADRIPRLVLSFLYLYAFWSESLSISQFGVGS